MKNYDTILKMYFDTINANHCFGNSSSSYDNGSKNDASNFVQKLYLNSNYIESNFEEDFDLKKYRFKNLPDPISIREAASEKYIENLFNDPSIIENNAHIDLNYRNVTNARFFQINQLPQIDSHLTAKLFVDNAIVELSLVRNNKDNDFGNFNLTTTKSFTLNTRAVNDNHVITKAYVDQFHSDNEKKEDF